MNCCQIVNEANSMQSEKKIKQNYDFFYQAEENPNMDFT